MIDFNTKFHARRNKIIKWQLLDMTKVSFQLTITCSKSTIEIIEKIVKDVQS